VSLKIIETSFNKRAVAVPHKAASNAQGWDQTVVSHSIKEGFPL